MSLSVVKSSAWQRQQRVLGRPGVTQRAPLRVSAAASSGSDAVLETLRKGAKNPGSVPGRELLPAVIALEKEKRKPDGWEQAISAPSHRWRLIYTAPAKDVIAASKKGGQPKGFGSFFPIAACQKFDSAAQTFENGVFLGPIFHLTFKGPYTMVGRNLYFDVCTMYLGLGPLRVPITIKKDCSPLAARDPKAVKKLPFFVYAWADNDIICARGRSGGMALWQRADTEWMVKAGVLQVYN